jgi:hypothetical protein
MVRVLIGLLVVGGRCLEHLKYLATGPLLHRFARVRVWLTACTVSRSASNASSLPRWPAIRFSAIHGYNSTLLNAIL